MSYLTDPLELFFRDCLWQTTLCLSIGLAGSFCWRKRPARAHRVLFLALIASLMAPIFSLAVRNYGWGLLPSRSLHATAEATAPMPPRSAILPRSSSRVEASSAPAPLAIGSVVSETKLPEGVDAPQHQALSAISPFHWQLLVAWIWFGLSALAALRLSLSILRGRTLIVRAKLTLESSIRDAANSAASKLKIASAPEARVSDEIGCPVIWCWGRRPLLLIPKDSVRSTRSIDWESLFAHELAHWKRKDHLSELCAELIAVILPWQPLVWVAKARLAHLADAVCDEWVLHCGQLASTYADSLVEMLPQARPVGAIPAVRNREKLKRRIQRILNHESPQPLTGVWWARCIGVGFALITGLLAFLQIQTKTLASPASEAQDKEEAEAPKLASATKQKSLVSASARRLVTGNSQNFYDDEDNLALSPDGRYLARVSLNSELILVDTRTGQQKKLAERCDWGAVWSADGKRIAFGSRPDGVPLIGSTATNRVFRAVDVDTGKSAVLWEGDLYIEEWSSENQILLGYRGWNFGGPSSVLVDLRSGKKTDFAGNPIARGYSRRLSPDGKSIGYCSGGDMSELCIHDIAASNRVVLAEFPGKKSDPIWSPDGKHLAFRCSQPGAGQEHQDLWCVQVRDGKFVGTPFPIMGDVGAMKFYNWARNGQLLYSVAFRPRSGLYALPIDPKTARATDSLRRLIRSEARQLYSNQGATVHTWSPDSKEIAFVLNRELYFVSAANGETLRRLSLSKLKEMDAGFGIDWSPDGRTIAISGTDDQKRHGLHGINVQTGEMRLLLEVEADARVWSSKWMADGKSIAFDGHRPRGIYVINLDDRVPQLIARPPSHGRGPYHLPAVARDGRSLYFSNFDRQVFNIGIDTKEPREFLPQIKAAGLRLGGFSWLPDSRFVVFQAKKKIWSVAVPDGEPFEIFSLPNELDGYSMSAPHCSPDGRLLTFAVDSDKVEYWVMENFLPPEKLAVR